MRINRTGLMGLAALLAIGLLALQPALACDKDKAATATMASAGTQTTLTGWIVDKDCGAANAKAEGKDCILACAKKGSPLMLSADGKLYKISDQKLAKKNVGHEVTVTGTVGEDGTLQVESIAKAETKKA